MRVSADHFPLVRNGNITNESKRSQWWVFARARGVTVICGKYAEATRHRFTLLERVGLTLFIVVNAMRLFESP